MCVFAEKRFFLCCVRNFLLAPSSALFGGQRGGKRGGGRRQFNKNSGQNVREEGRTRPGVGWGGVGLRPG